MVFLNDVESKEILKWKVYILNKYIYLCKRNVKLKNGDCGIKVMI